MSLTIFWNQRWPFFAARRRDFCNHIRSGIKASILLRHNCLRSLLVCSFSFLPSPFTVSFCFPTTPTHLSPCLGMCNPGSVFSQGWSESELAFFVFVFKDSNITTFVLHEDAHSTGTKPRFRTRSRTQTRQVLAMTSHNAFESGKGLYSKRMHKIFKWDNGEETMCGHIALAAAVMSHFSRIGSYS